MANKKSKNNNSKNRPPILPATQLKLWLLAGGRCQFRGCSEPLWIDGLTLKETNYSNIAHIVSYSSNGPRGDIDRSPKLATEFSNLMLVCMKHHKLIDDKKYEKDYPEELLLEYKQEHEKRTEMLLSHVKENGKTTVLIFKAKIGDIVVDIDPKQAYQAILPKYPEDEKGIFIDLTNLDNYLPSFWNTALEQIKQEVQQKLATGNNEKNNKKHLSIFALAPMPLLMQLGRVIGNKIPADLYQRHRDTEDWKWKSCNCDDFEYRVKRPKLKSSKKVALKLSLSGKIHDSEIVNTLRDGCANYEITYDPKKFGKNKKLSPLFLNFKGRLTKFKECYRMLLSEIREVHGENCEIHLFPAIPAPIAVECGRSLLPKVDPKIFVYELDKEYNKNNEEKKFKLIFQLQ